MRRVRRKGANKEKVFGCDLLEHLNTSSQEIPQVLRCCSEFVETHGIVDGIYRLSGVSSNIQKLRTDFESDGTPDLNKDVYLQDIHCVSSLCKAYFRELPNPLLTYQLYDKFAEAVAIQLEEERLVKIKDVLKELPNPHYRTLEYLMHHLVRMASFSSETNMHARNLAIVWAPNLLRSKDIEVSGFNGTAVFKEVRVQSIVVEFILTHVPQLFPEQGVLQQRRKSLPSPESTQDVDPFKFPRTQAVLNFGNICPGDAPLPIRPYHAIIEGTDKRKGSLKGKKWMSIFNIGSRFHDPLKRHKHSAKEKDRTVLRPARSMDSLSTPSYPNEGSIRTSGRPSTKSSPLVTPSTQPGLDTNAISGAIGGSEYAVTYRRGTGLVSGSAGNQGSSPALDLEGLKSTNHETFQARSNGDSAKSSRRAAMHITGPTLVTVPLHITTNLAFGVLQRGGSERIIHYGRDKDEKGNVPDKEKAEEMKLKNDEGEKNNEEVLMDRIEDTEACGGTEEASDGKNEKPQEEQEDCGYNLEMVMANRPREQPKTPSSSSEQAKSVTEDNDDAREYMVMKSTEADFEPVLTSNISDNLNLTEVEEDDLTLSGYVEDSFEFLDHMDCSVLDHMDCSVPYQVHEFSVEPPGHSDDEYEVMEQGHPSHQLDEQQMHMQPIPGSESHRLLSIDTHSRHIKSLSLPYVTSPIHGPEESGSDDDDYDDNNAGVYYSSEDEESMFVKSLPSDFFLKDLSGSDPEIEKQDKYAPEAHPVCVQITEDTGSERSACIESPGDLKQIDMKDSEVNEGWEEKEFLEREDKDKIHQQSTHLEKGQRAAAGDSSSIVDDPQSSDNKQQPLTAEASTYCCSKYPVSADEESGVAVDAIVNKQKEVVDFSESSYADCLGSETVEVLFEESNDGSEIASEPDDGEDREKKEMHRYKETEDVIQDNVLETSVNDGGKWNIVADIEPEEQMEESGESRDIWNDHVDVPGEIAKQEGDMQNETKCAGQSDVVEVMGLETAKVDFNDGETNEKEVRTEAVKESRPVENLEEPESQLETEEKGAMLGKTEELETNQCVISDTRCSQDKVDRFSAAKEKSERNSGLKAVGKQLVISKHPKVHQVKAVPVVPPKPQHCRITALTLRQQQQEQHQTPSVRDRLDSDRGRETMMKVVTHKDDVCEGDQEKDRDKMGQGKEKPILRGGEREGGIDGRRNSPLSMCFDEAVAIATMRREKEKEYEKEKQRDWGNEMQ